MSFTILEGQGRGNIKRGEKFLRSITTIIITESAVINTATETDGQRERGDARIPHIPTCPIRFFACVVHSLCVPAQTRPIGNMSRKYLPNIS